MLVRRHGDFDRCEDAVQEALLEAHLAWRDVPERPFGWLLTVAERRLLDGLRSDAARARREERQAMLEPPATEGWTRRTSTTTRSHSSSCAAIPTSRRHLRSP